MNAGKQAVRLPPGSFIEAAPVQAVLGILDRDGEQARVVGGAVRNALMDLAHGDIDIATTALPEVVCDRARAAGMKAVPTGIEHGTVTLVLDHHPFEVTTLREDVDTDGRHATVVFGRDFSHDARRRDFTMNALYADRHGVIEDHVGGIADIEARHVRFIGDPAQRIREDYLRILRLFRFHAHYGSGPLDADALHAAIQLRGGLARLSAERIRAELLKLLVCRNAAETVATVAASGFLDRILAEIGDVRAFAALTKQDPSKHDPILRLAALALRTGDDAARLHERLRLSNAEGQRLLRMGQMLERLHGRFGQVDRTQLREWGYRYGNSIVRDALAITAARRRKWPWPEDLAAAAQVLESPAPVCPFGGAAVLAHGIAPGPIVGVIVARAEALWIDAGFPEDEAIRADILERAMAASLAK